MTTMSKQINFTIVPDDTDDPSRARREYANFCAVAHTPFDLTLTFCDVRPLSEKDIKSAEQSQTVRAPVVARIALPFTVVPGLIAALLFGAVHADGLRFRGRCTSGRTRLRLPST